MTDHERMMEILRRKIAELEACATHDEKEILRKKNLLATFEANILGMNQTLPKRNREDDLLPEYRKGGYFTSQDYYDKCAEFHQILESHGVDYMHLSRSEYVFLKKEFFLNTYGIVWLAEEYQFLPSANIIDVHIDRF